MENLGLVSIVMPMYNDERYVRTSIESVINQTYPFWELLIVDDCSTDKSKTVVASFDDPRILLFSNNSNSGAAFSRNIALQNAKGKWVAFLDADDFWLPKKLEAQLGFMVSKRFCFSYTNYYEMSENTELNGRLITGPEHLNKRSMHHICYPGCLTMMYEKSVVGLIQVPQEIRKRNDDAIILQVVKKADCYLLSENLACYRVRKGSISHVSRSKLLFYHYKVFRLVDKKTWLGSWICAFRNVFFYFWKKGHYVKRVDISKVDLSSIIETTKKGI